MKPSSILKLTIFLVLSFFANVAFSQISTGMAIQGIARDASNNAETNKAITLRFTVHYTNSSNANVDLDPILVGLTTDAFGVFSYVLDMSAIETSLFYDFKLKLKIEQTLPISIAISDEYLNYVPYAVSANNGVPTGTIIAYVGSEAPRGWALCDGSTLPTSAVTLRTLLGTANTPNLSGMFLRGTGSQTINLKTFGGNTLKGIQEDGIKSHTSTIPDHSHGLTDGGHTHPYNDIYHSESFVGSTIDVPDSFGSGDSDNNNRGWEIARTTSNSTTGITVNNTSLTATYTGGTETRPVNYGVTYIIKL
jgi:hypothetical protein